MSAAAPAAAVEKKPEETPLAAAAAEKEDEKPAAAAAAAAVAAADAAAVAGGGELLFCGWTQWETMGRKTPPAGSTFNILSPTRLRPLVGIDIRFVASGCTACHCLALDAEGRCYTWGRNEKGQLGHGDTLQRSLPTIVAQLSKYNIIRAGVGRNHTVVVSDAGKSFAFGMNKHGQLGSGSTRNEIEASPVPCLVSEATNAVCGSDFTVWLSSVEGSTILTAGLPQYGQLGHGTDNEYNSKEGSVKLAYEGQPRPRAVAFFSGKTVVKVACGTNHTVAVDSNGFVYTWGFGGYGRLGHREPKDEWIPRLVEVFQKYNLLPPDAVVSAGSASSACTAGGGQLYMWGKIKNSGGDDWMYPKAVMDLSGWNIRCMASGNLHHVVGADESCISWGHAVSGELGYGPLGQKSSANPKKIDILDGMHVTSVGCGSGLSLIVVDRTRAGDKLDELDVYDGQTAVEEAEGNGKVVASPATAKKRAPKSPANSNKRKKNDSSDSQGSEHDDDDDDEDDSSDESEGIKRKRGGKTSGRGRGRGAKKAAIESISSSKRGRGRPKSSGKEAEKVSSGRVSGRGRGRPKSKR